MSSQPTRSPGLCLSALIVICGTLTGCEYDRSFMNINSDSGVPFLGLQLTVDAHDAQQPTESTRLPLQDSGAAETTAPSQTMRAQSPEFPDAVPTPRRKTSEHEFLIPVSEESHPLDPIHSISRRLAAF